MRAFRALLLVCLQASVAAAQPAVPAPAAFAYYESVGQNWERAAFIKARAAAERAMLEALRAMGGGAADGGC